MARKLITLFLITLLSAMVIGFVDFHTSIPDQSWLEDTQHTLNLSDYFTTSGTVNAVASNIDNISISFNGLMATLTPESDFYGTRTVYFNVSNGTDTVQSNTVTLKVNNTNDAPTIDSWVPNGNQEVRDNQDLLFNVTASDIDQDTLTYEWKLNNSVQSSTSNAYTFNEQAGVYAVSVKVTDSHVNASKSWTVTVLDKPKMTEFDGDTTNLTGKDQSNLANFVLHKSGKAKIEFTQNVDISETLDIDSYVELGTNAVALDKANLPELDKPAKITIYGLSYGEEPLVYTSSSFTTDTNSMNTLCTDCTNKNYANGTMTFEVSHFSSYTTKQKQSAALEITTSKILIGTAGNDRNETITGSFVVKNIGSLEAVNGVTVSDAINSRYNIAYSLSSAGTYADSLSNLNFAASEEKTIYIRGTLPASEDSGEHSIGKVTVASTNLSVQKDLYVDPVSKLYFDEIILEVNGKDKTVTEDKIIDVELEDTLDLKVNVENTFTDDIEIQSIEVSSIIENIDDDEDMEDDASDFDLKDGKDKTVTLSFKVPEKAEEGQYVFRVKAEGNDENGAAHTAELKFYIDVQKQDYDLRIVVAELTSETLKCDRVTQLVVEVANRGNKDEDEARLVISSPALGINYEKSDLELSSDYDDDENEYRVTQSIELKDNFAAGTYPIYVKLYRDETRLEMDKTVFLTVQSCTTTTTSSSGGSTSTGTTTTSSGKEEVVVVYGQGAAGSQLLPGYEAVSATSDVTEEIDFKDSFEYTLLLVAIGAIVLGGLIFLVGAMMIKAQKKQY